MYETIASINRQENGYKLFATPLASIYETIGRCDRVIVAIERNHYIF